MGNKASIARFLNSALLPKNKQTKKKPLVLGTEQNEKSSYLHSFRWICIFRGISHVQEGDAQRGQTKKQTQRQTTAMLPEHNSFQSTSWCFLLVMVQGEKKKHVDYKVTVIFLGKRERWFLRKYFWSSPSVGSQHTAPTNWLHCNSAIKQQQNHHTPQLYSLKSLGMGKAQGGTKN